MALLAKKFDPRLMLTLFLSVLALAGCSQSLGSLASVPEAQNSVYAVESGDKLRIKVQDQDSVSGEYIVDESGSISLPLIKDVVVRGKGFREIETTIEDRFRSGGFLNRPVVTVQPVALRPFYVLGEVNKPGEFEFRQGMTVLAAVSVAGGYTYRARTGEVALTRTVNGRQETLRAGEDDLIQPGDRIKVVESWF